MTHMTLSWLVRRNEKRGGQPDYQRMMRAALDQMNTAERMVREADTLEQLEIARAALQQAQAEVQRVIRMAKRDRGIALRPIAETEALHKQLREYLRRTGMRRLVRGAGG